MVLLLLAYLNFLCLKNVARYATDWTPQRQAGLGITLYLAGLLTLALTYLVVEWIYSFTPEGHVIAQALTQAAVGGLWAAYGLAWCYRRIYSAMGGEHYAA